MKDSRTDLILSEDLDIDGEERAATLARYKRFIMQQCPAAVAVNVAGYPAGIHKNTTGRSFLVVGTTVTPALGTAWEKGERLAKLVVRSE